jgi:[ribosomal protein S5]-alanine N-acetyltransferase
VTESQIRIDTARLVLRRPRASDVDSIFRSWASKPEVTRYMSWPRHESPVATLGFLRFSDSQWERWPAGPLVIELSDCEQLIGSTGYGFRSSVEAEVGYILDNRFWGSGYATEAMEAIIELAPCLGLERLTASVHPANTASMRVLAKCGFALQPDVSSSAEYPNLEPGAIVESLVHSRVVGLPPQP